VAQTRSKVQSRVATPAWDAWLTRVVAGALSLGLALPAAARADEPKDEDKEGAAVAEPDEAPPAPTKPDAANPAKSGQSLLDQVDTSSEPQEQPANWDMPAAPPEPKYPYFEYHGYFRFRPDIIGNGHLGFAASRQGVPGEVVTTSSILPPLSQWPNNNDSTVNQFSKDVGKSRGESSILGANMRFRIMPTMHLSDTIRIVSTMDILDNYVLGSSPDYAGALKRADVPLTAFATSTTPGIIAIKEVYGEWKTLLGLLRIGRQGSQWGLGILANSGNGDGWDGGRPLEYYGGPRLPHEGHGYDSDFGSFADRVAFLTKIGPIYATVFYDMVSAGHVGYDPTRVDGQARDLGSADDVWQIGGALFKKPLSAQDAEKRRALLVDDNKDAFDYGVYGAYREQSLDESNSDAKTPGAMTLQNAKDAMLFPRNAWAFIGDGWARYENRLSFAKRLVIEGEFSYIRGKIGDANGVGDIATVKPRELEMWGGALKAAYQDEGLAGYLDAGVASGDDTACFGVNGMGNCSITKVDPGTPPKETPNTQITGFKFHKNYRVDSLLFREVIGAVTNAWYVKPTFSINAYPFYAQHQLGADLSVLGAGAMNAAGTPGGKSWLGTEFEVKGFLGQKGLYYGDVVFSYLLPGGAFDLKKDWNQAEITANSIAPENAWRLMGHVTLMF